MARTKVTVLAISDIRADGGTQTRDTIDPSTVEAYRTGMADGVEFPPIVVFYDGGSYWLADGFHRVEAAKGLCETIECDVRQGSQRDAIMFSVGANATHGLRRTNADKRRAVDRLLSDPEWSKESDRWIADRCHVSHTMVADERRRLTCGKAASTATSETPARAKAPRANKHEAPNAQVEIERLMDGARTRRELDSAYTRLTQAADDGYVSLPEAEALTKRYREAITRVSDGPPEAEAYGVPVETQADMLIALKHELDGSLMALLEQWPAGQALKRLHTWLAAWSELVKHMPWPSAEPIEDVVRDILGDSP